MSGPDIQYGSAHEIGSMKKTFCFQPVEIVVPTSVSRREVGQQVRIPLSVPFLLPLIVRVQTRTVWEAESASVRTGSLGAETCPLDKTEGLAIFGLAKEKGVSPLPFLCFPRTDL